MTRRLPKLLYVGDIPVEASYQSSIQLHRLLEAFPPDRLCIVETREPASQEARRLRGVRYHALPLATRAAMRGAWSGMHRLWLTRTAAGRAPEVLRLIDGFAPEAVLTIGSGFGWLPAAAIAQRLGIPLHLIAHDDWPKPSGIDGALLSWSRSHYGRVYRQAQSRLCISPFMIERFERRYGAKGTLLYPLRAPDGVTGATASARTIQDGEPIVIGFCGGSGAHVMPGLVSLGRAVAASDARVIVFGPFDDAKRSLLGSLSTGFEFRGVAAHAEMMAGLRQADLLFAPMTFESRARSNMSVSFPSKLADYTAAGVPILVHGPSYCSAVRWAAMHGHAAATVTVDDPTVLRDAIAGLARSRARRQELADLAVQAGQQCFDFSAGRAAFEGALR